MGGNQVPNKLLAIKEGINQGWPIKDYVDHKKSLRTIKRVCGPEESQKRPTCGLPSKGVLRETVQQSRPYQQVQLTLAVDDKVAVAGR